MDDFITLALAVTGAALFSAAGLWPAVGWFIGMTAGQLLSLESETTTSTTVGPRRTEFRGLNSAFGGPIPKAYGTVRLNGNVIWAGPVEETLHIQKNCVSQQVGGFFGLFDKNVKQCSQVATYHYKQSFAVAFAQGPATEFVTVWANGTLLFDNGTSNVTQDAADSLVTGRPENIAGPATVTQEVFLSEFFTMTTTPALRFYLGTSTQGVDPTIAEIVGAANCPAFRNTVYLVVTELDLEYWGYRIPEITAEIAFETGGALPAHKVKDLTQGGGTTTRTFDRWVTEVWADGNEAIAVELQDAAPVWTTIDVYSGDMTLNFEWLPIIRQYLGSEPNIVEQGPHFGKKDKRGMWYWTGLVCGANCPLIVQYDPIKGAIQQASSAGFTFVDYPEHLLHDDVRGLTYAVSDVGNAFGVFVSDPVVYALRNNMTIPEEDDVVEAFQIYHPPITFPGNGAMVMDKDGIVWLAGNSTNPIYKYDPDTNVLQGLGTLTDTTQSPPENITGVSGITYSYLDDTLVLLAEWNGDDGAAKYDRTNHTITLSNKAANTGWTIDAPSNWNKGPFDGGLYIYYTGVGVYIRLNVMTLETETWGFGDWEQTNNPLSGPWVPQVRAWISTGVGQFSYLRGGGGSIGLDEVVSDLILKDDVVEARYGITASDIDVSNLASKSVRGYPITSQQSIRGAIVPLQQGYFFDYVESDGILLFRFRGRSSIATIADDELAAHEWGSQPNERLQITYQEELSLPRELAVNYIDFNRAYGTGTQRFRRLNTNASSNTTLTLPIVFSADEAQEIAEVLHSNAWTERQVFNFRLGPKYMYLDPTDQITISLDTGGNHFIRLTKVVIGRNGIVECEGVADSTSLYTAPNAVGEFGAYVPAPFLWNPITLNPFTPALPPLTVTNDDFNLHLGLTGYDSGGIFQPVDVYVAEPGSSPRLVGSIDSLTSSAIIQAEVEHPDTPGGFYGSIDSGQTITLTTTTSGAPSSITEEQLFEGVNNAILGDEVIAFQTVTAQSPDTGTYTLSNVIRGLNGTDHNVDRHVFPEPFILVDNLLTVPMDESSLNQTVTIILKPKGSDSVILDVIEYQGATAAPLAPSHPTVTSSGSPEDYVFSWVRRDRVFGAWSYSGDIPNSEDTEDSELDIMDRDGNVLRTLTATDTQTATYTNANMITDFGAVPSTIYAILYQISATVGRGFPRRFVGRPAGEYYFRNFAADLASPPTTPANITQRWDTTGYTYLVEADSTSDYGAVLHFNITTDDRYLISLDDLGETRDVELLIRFKVSNFVAPTSTNKDAFRVYLRARGADGTEKGIVFGVARDGGSMGFFRYNNGTSITDTSVNFSTLAHLAGFGSYLTADVWYRVRVRASGWRYKAKLWRDDTNEPGAWDMESYVSMTHEYGWTGIGAWEADNDFKADWIYAAVNGRRAG